MKFFTDKIKLIVIFLSILNLGSTIFLFFFHTPIIYCFLAFFTIEILLLGIYTLVTTYKWLNYDFQYGLKKNKEDFLLLHNQLETQAKYFTDLFIKQQNLITEIVSQKTETIKQILSNKITNLSEKIELNSIQNTNTLKTIEEFELNTEKILEEYQLELRDKLKTNLIQSKNINRVIEEFQATTQEVSKKNHLELISKLEINSKQNIATSKSIEEFELGVQKIINKFYSEVLHILSAINSDIAYNKIHSQQLEEAINNGQRFIISKIQDDYNSLLKEQGKKEANISKNIDNVSNIINNKIIQGLNTTYNRIDALLSIHNLIKLNAPLPIMHEWRISSDYAHEVLSSILEKKEGNVIDIGSGVSTILWGYGVKQNGKGKVLALEHSKEYYQKTKALIKAHQLENYCELHYCPLIEYTIDNKKWLWYDINKVNILNNISVISVDGPPGSTQYMARYPAIPLLTEFISENTLVFLDDGNRDEEKLIAEKWEVEQKLITEYNNDYKGTYKLKLK